MFDSDICDLRYVNWGGQFTELRAVGIMEYVCVSTWRINISVTSFICEHGFSYLTQRSDPVELKELHTQFTELKYANKNS